MENHMRQREGFTLESPVRSALLKHHELLVILAEHTPVCTLPGHSHAKLLCLPYPGCRCGN